MVRIYSILSCDGLGNTDAGATIHKADRRYAGHLKQGVGRDSFQQKTRGTSEYHAAHVVPFLTG